MILDGLAVRIKMAETAVRLQRDGTFVSRKMLYQMPGAVVRERAKQDYGLETFDVVAARRITFSFFMMMSPSLASRSLMDWR